MFRALLYRAELRPKAGGGGAGGPHEAILQGSGTLGRDSHIHRYSRFCVLLSVQRELNDMASQYFKDTPEIIRFKMIPKPLFEYRTKVSNYCA